MDAAGYLRITGRIKDLIIRGGENIHPVEIENCLLAHGAVQDACVVGLKDARYGEVVAAYVRPRAAHAAFLATDAGGAALQAWVRARLSAHLVPKYVIAQEGDFPKTGSGKVEKYKVREAGERWLAARREWERIAGAVAAEMKQVREVACFQVAEPGSGNNVLVAAVRMKAGARFAPEMVRRAVKAHYGDPDEAMDHEMGTFPSALAQDIADWRIVPKYVVQLNEPFPRSEKGKLLPFKMQDLVQTLLEKGLGNQIV